MPHTMYDYKDSTEKGSEIEELFKKSFHNAFPNYSINFTTKIVNSRKHIDVVCENEDKQLTFDVKAQKLISRQDAQASSDYTWVEIQNNFGGPGWCKGEEEFIAFELNEQFIIVRRDKLLELVESRKAGGILTENRDVPAYGQYQRAKWGNKDICVLTPIEDILAIKLGTIRKV